MVEVTPVWSRWQDYLILTKPRVVALMLLCALVGMLLAPRTDTFSIVVFLYSMLGIALVAGSAAVMNHVADAKIDAQMARTDGRPIPTGRLSVREGLIFAGSLGMVGFLLLFYLVNPLTAWLNLISWIGYAVVYTLWLKHATTQNIVLGGLFGAAPPLFGWTAVTGTIAIEPILLVLIIFLWTPPHFWALALARLDDYAKASVPMLPVRKGVNHTKRQILIYIGLLFLSSLLPFLLGYANLVYGVSAVVFGLGFVCFGIRTLREQDRSIYHATFRYSIVYLMLLFVALLVDHFVIPVH